MKDKRKYSKLKILVGAVVCMIVLLGAYCIMHKTEIEQMYYIAQLENSKSSSKTQTVDSVAEVTINNNKIYYNDIYEAVKAGNYVSSTIKLLKNITLTESIKFTSIKGTTTLDLNGKEINSPNDAAIYVSNEVIFNLTGSTRGYIKAGNSNDNLQRAIVNNGDLNIDGEVEIAGITNNETGKITIYSGTINSPAMIDAISNLGYIHIKDVTISCGEGGAIDNGKTGSILIDESANITGGWTKGAINNFGTLTLGQKKYPATYTDDIVICNNANVSNPTIYNAGIFNYYDGTIKGQNPLSGEITDLPDNYEPKITVNESIKEMQLEYSSAPTVATANGTNYSSLQTAINSCTNNVETEITIVRNISEKSSKIATVPAGKKIKLNLNKKTLSSMSRSYRQWRKFNSLWEWKIM